MAERTKHSRFGFHVPIRICVAQMPFIILHLIGLVKEGILNTQESSLRVAT